MFESSSDFTSLTDFYRAAGSPYSNFDQTHLAGGSLGARMMMVEQRGNDFTDPAVPEIAICGVLNAATTGCWDFGEKWSDRFELQRGTFTIQPANQDCRFDVPGLHKIIVALLPWDRVLELLDGVNIHIDPFERSYGDLLRDPRCLRNLTGMWHAMKEGGPANSLAVDGFVHALLALLLDASACSYSTLPPALDDPRLTRVIDYIEDYFYAPLLTSELAKIAGMSEAHFPRAFRAATGRSPHRYLTERRLARARQLLATTKMSVTEIAYASGFGSAPHFSTVFGREFGVPPSAYRDALN